MIITIAETCGLCNGCKRAINTTIEKLNNGNKVTIFKEIVHNKNVNNLLLALGAKTQENIQEIDKTSLVVLRAHGEPPATYDYLNQNGIEYVDCTCPNVELIHRAIEKYSPQSYEIILLGKYKEKMHPEVVGTIGWSKTKCHIVQDIEDIAKIRDIKDKKLYLACQTTFNMALADKLIENIKSIANTNNCELIINKSICNAQKQINESSASLAKNVDFMIVVGGKNSSNSKELYNNVSTICPSIFIEDIYEYKKALFEANIKITKDSKIGLTAGASTMQDELVALKKIIEKEFCK